MHVKPDELGRRMRGGAVALPRSGMEQARLGWVDCVFPSRLSNGGGGGGGLGGLETKEVGIRTYVGTNTPTTDD